LTMRSSFLYLRR
ncbi:hypothetical protein D047_2084B, partial [Vibrio parahaemolyticus VPTS-2010_2]